MDKEQATGARELSGGFDGKNASCTIPYMTSILLGTIYVASLYIWKQDPKEPSTHPRTMKKRFISVFFTMLISPFYVYYFIHTSLLQESSLWSLLGFRLAGLPQAIVLPMLLTMLLFLGPITMQAFHGMVTVYGQPSYWLAYMKEVVWIRNYVVAPVSEEFVFRACMLALVIHCTEPVRAVFICPLFFGMAHLHHLLEQIRLGTDWKIAILNSLFKFTYTTIFGAYSAYLFLRTGHIISPILVHSFCNHMGFPDFGALSDMPNKNQRLFCSVSFLVGVILWALLVQPLTEPSLYHNNLPWSSRI